MIKKNIFCIPFAGGSADYYETWREEINNITNEFEIVPIELAGKGKRKFEEMYQTMEEAVEDVYNCISSKINEIPYAIFGHSMGSAIAFEVCKLLEKRNRNRPVHLFCSGRQAPHIVYNTRASDLNDEALKEHIMNFEYFNSNNDKLYRILGLYIETLRNDFRIVDNYQCRSLERLEIPITVMCGNEDAFELENIYTWKAYTKDFDSYIFEGGHFYINDHYHEIIKIILDKLKDT